ncbi:MAG: hypothetical protein GXO07_06100 [Crenarchaeota archaeon]|nr:hypothetical protein [Thermoproteota archaeon]
MMGYVKLNLKLKVVSDYLHVTGTVPCLPLNDVRRQASNYLPFTCLNDKPALFGSSVKGAVRSRADLTLKELRASKALMGWNNCQELRLEAKDYRRLRGRTNFQFSCCQGGSTRSERASWRHLAVWFEEVRECKSYFKPEEELDKLFGIDRGKEMVPSRTFFSTFFSEGDVVLKRLRLGRAWVAAEVVPRGIVFEGSVVLENSNEMLLSALLYSLGLFKREPKIMLGRFKYKKVYVEGDGYKTFGHLAVELTSVESLGFEVPRDPRRLVESYKETFKKHFSVNPDFDEFERLRRVLA